MLYIDRCLKHIINLTTQALLDMYLKSGHYDPAEPDVNLHVTPTGWQRDEVGLIRSIYVKVSLLYARTDS